MEMKNIWNKLISSETETLRSEKGSFDQRTAFDSDYDRIIFSSPFRRLQDKAQVFPLEKSDFVRTRLTHSLEVASIARSIGISLVDKLNIEDNLKIQIPVILECAGLAHDLGNPPFGHFGEETIKRVFAKVLKEKVKIKIDRETEEYIEVELNDLQKKDFENFDGNCQTIRILTRLQCLSDSYGMHITYATLATLMKYPQNSLNGNKKTAPK